MAVERAPAKTWLTYEGSDQTFAEAHSKIGSMAARLHDEGVRRGTAVVSTMRNSPDYLFAWLGLMRLGAVLLPIDPESTPQEAAGFIGQADPELIVTDADLAGALPSPHGRVVPIEELAASEGDPPAIAAHQEDVAVLIPTSGTTGRSKLVMQTQRAYGMAGEGFPYWMELGEDDRLMTSLPLFHINAAAYSTMGSIAAGAGLILLPRFSARRFLDEARRYGATEFNAIGAMLEILMRQPERDDDADNPFRLCYTGPSPSKERQLEIERRFDLRLVCGYALSETPYGLIWAHGTRPYGTLGSVRQHPRLGVVNEARVVSDGEPVAAGGVGELELKNPAVMVGYYEMPEETAAVLQEGWLRTGDLVEVNADGTYTFVGRRKEIIRRRGENLSPVEVEAALESHPHVSEAAVVGVPSDLTEEDVKAFVVLSSADAVTMHDLRAFVASKLASFKVPRYFEAVPELPHTPTGRIAKHELTRERTDREVDLDPEPASAGGVG